MPQDCKVGIYIIIHVEDVGRLDYYSLVSNPLEVAADALDCVLVWQLGVMSVMGELVDVKFDIRPFFPW